MLKIIKFSKSYKNIFRIKKDFYENNKNYLNNSLKINKIYKKQPLRKFCKNCNSKKIKKFIKSFGIPYNICLRCGHLNGAYQDTNNFANQLYKENDGKNYSKNYLDNYNQRVNHIYIPKVDFLKKVIKGKIKVIDLGCGAGHFVKALEKKKISAIGYDTSKLLCKLGNQKLKKNKILPIELNEIYELNKKDKTANTLSLIHVLEHLVEPEKFLNLLK
jgi:2-polyprenyl-3-methyl-5-hydroxy-6-metoxy-1,4-benzoquinol methylase